EELTAIISQELHIDVAFPCFSVEEQTGATACCVVCVNEATSDINTGNNPDQSNDYRQAPTTNVLVSVFLKRKLSDNISKPQLYSRKPHDNDISQKKSKDKFDYSLRYFLKEQYEGKPILDLAEIEAQYESYFPLIQDEDLQNAKGSTELEQQLTRQKVFVEKFIEMLYPESAYFRILPQLENDVLSVELRSQPDWSSDMPITTSPNLIDVFAVLESDRAYYFIAPYRGTTLQDLLKYSSGVLNSNRSNSRRVDVYDVDALVIIHIFQLHSSTSRFYHLGSNFQTYLLMKIYGLHSQDLSVPFLSLLGDQRTIRQKPLVDQVSQSVNDFVMENIPREIKDDSPTMKWVRGDISNFDYIMNLNNLAGKYVFFYRRSLFMESHTLVTYRSSNRGSQLSSDFPVDYRLHRFVGDEQLDFTFDGPVPHHITDILSDITYYVYLARKTPIPFEEVMASVSLSNPIFTISDIGDRWASTAEEFIRLHAEALESDYVSKNLHLWIDLTFGCRLSGDDAVEAKNVALPLLDGQNSFMKHGITQLFSDSHPHKIINSAQESDEMIFDSMLVTTNDNRSLREKYESISSKKRIPSKILDTSKITSQHIVEISNDLLVGLEKTTGKHQSIAGHASPKLASALHEIVNADEKEISSSTLDPKDPSFRIEALSNLVNSLPIHLPDEMEDDYFTDSLDNFEQAHTFSAKYPPQKFLSAECELSGDNDGNKYCQRRNSTKVKSTENTFSYGKAWDTYCLGKIIKALYSSSTDNNTALSLLSSCLEEGDQVVDNCKKLPLSVQSVVSALLNPDWTKRPSIDALIYSSVPVMSLHDAATTLPLPECIPEVYEFLTDFHQVLVLLFTQDSIKIEALNIFSKLGQRLGQDETKNHLLKPIVSLFETSRPSIPPRLFDRTIITHFVHRFGVANFLQQLFPLYLEALTIEDNVVPMAIDDGVFTDQKLKLMTDHESVSSSTSAAKNPLSSLDNALPSVAQLANSALVTICTLIGPILTSKNVMRQLYKMLLKESTTLPFLMQSILAIGNRFGETFTHLQFAQVIPVIQQYSTYTMDKKNYLILCNHLSLLEKLTTLMPNSKVLSEIDSLFSETLIKLLVQFNNEDNLTLEKNGSPTGSAIQIIKNRFSVSVKSVEFLLHVCNNATKSDWEKHIAPILQKYFESFGKSLENLGIEESERRKLEQDRNQQKVYDKLFPEGMLDSMRCVVTFCPDPLLKNAYNSSGAIELAMSGSVIPNELLISYPPSSNSPDNHASSDRISVRSVSSSHNGEIKEKSSSAPGTPKFSVNFEDKKHLTLSSKDVTSIVSTTTSSSLSVNRAFSSFSSEGANCDGRALKELDYAFEDFSPEFGNQKDRMVKLWSLDVHYGIENSNSEPSSEPLISYNGHKRSMINDVHFISGGVSWGPGDTIAKTLIAVGSTSGVISLLESRTGSLLGSWKAGDADIVQGSHVICIWDTDNMSLANTIRVASEVVTLNMYKEEVISVNNSNAITFSPLNENHLDLYESNEMKNVTMGWGKLDAY
ncbi:10987_t:CDS:10, partial [Acaulospora colombiana]